VTDDREETGTATTEDADGTTEGVGDDELNETTMDADGDLNGTLDGNESTTDADGTTDAEVDLNGTTDGTEGALDGTTDAADAEVTGGTESANETREVLNGTLDEAEDTVDDGDVTGTTEDLAGVDAVEEEVNGTVAALADATENTTAALGDSTETALAHLDADAGELTAPIEDPAAGTGGSVDTSAGTASGSDDGDGSSSSTPAASSGETGTSDAAGTGESGDDESAGGTGLPGGRTGSGALLGAVLVGTALLAREAGAAAVLSSAAGSSGSLLGAIVSLLRTWGHRLLLLLGYKRYSDDDPLEHETRKRLYDHIRSSPGTYLAELGEETGVEMGTVRYHLRILEFENLVSQETIRGHRRYFPAGTDWAELEAARNDDATAAILAALQRDGPDSVSGLAETLDRDPSTVSHHLDRLADDGVIERERDGRAVLNRLTTRAQQALSGPPTEATGATVPGEAD